MNRTHFQKANSSALTITEGWLTKKYMGSRKEDRRYIQLRSNMLYYYSSEPVLYSVPYRGPLINQSSGGALKGDIFLGDCQVSLLGETTFVISPGRGFPILWFTSFV